MSHGLIRAGVIFLAGALAGVGADRVITHRRALPAIAKAPSAPAGSTAEAKIAPPVRTGRCSHAGARPHFCPPEAPRRLAAGSRHRAPAIVRSPWSRRTTGRRPEQRDRDLAGERNLIEIARTALGRGHADSALASLRRHARLYPGRRAAREEREGLSIQALVVSGDVAAARERTARFRERYPRSLFTPAIDEALRSIP